jgi:uncharacterized protein YdaU (DUF1376 family)
MNEVRKMKIRYVQLESESFLTDLDFIRMSAQERGVYCTLLFYLYCNNGRCELDPPTLARMCNCSDFEKVWQNIAKKFQTRNGVIRHKRVSKELRMAKKFIQHQHKAGLTGASKRWHGHNDPNGNGNGVAIAKERKDKEKENKSEREKEEKRNISNCSFSSTSFRPSFDQQDRLRAKLSLEQAKKEFLADEQNRIL